MAWIKAGLAALAVLAPAALAQEGAYRSMPSAEFAKSGGPALLIDVREPVEWRDTGMPQGSIGISVSNPDFANQVLAQTGGDTSKPVAVICKSGARSERAAKLLTAAGFTHVTNISDGMAGRSGVGEGWLNANLPLEPPAS